MELHSLMSDYSSASPILLGAQAAEALRPLASSMRECASLCRSKREMALLVKTLQALGLVEVRSMPAHTVLSTCS